MVITLLLTGIAALNAQDNVVDKIIAVVGNQIVLKSDIETRFNQLQAQGYASGSVDLKTDIFEDLLIQKLMIAQAAIDSVEVTEQEVENDLDRKIEMYTQRIGSKEKLEQYFGKSILEMKNQLRDDSRNERIKERMQAEITKDIHITPAEVRAFYNQMNKDSLPIIPGELEVQQIVRYPQVTADEKDKIRTRLREFRDRVHNGESFSTLAVLYSEDLGSSRKGGELGYMPRTDLVPEFANVAFNLKTDKVSKIVETEFGFHIIQFIDRKGERINVRHILLKPKIEEENRKQVTSRLDSIRDLILSEKMKFNEAAFYFSEDKDTRNNGGLIVNPYTGSSRFEKDNLPPAIVQRVNTLKINAISETFLDVSGGKDAYKIIKIKSETKAHLASLSDEWSIFENMLTNKKQQDILNKWIKKKQINTYVHIDDSYKNAKFRFKNWQK